MATIYNYNQLFNVNITLNGAAFGDYTVTPVGSTAAALNAASLRCWRRPGETDFGVWFNQVTSPVGFNSPLHLYFLLQITDQSFYSYANLPMQQNPMTPPTWQEKKNPPLNKPLALNYYFLANHDKDLTIKVPGSLALAGAVSASDTIVDTKFYIDNKIDSFTSTAWMPFGLISIVWNAQAWQSGVTAQVFQPPEYLVNIPVINQ